MDPFFEIFVWMMMALLASGLGSRLLRADPRFGELENAVIAVSGAMVGGLVFMALFGQSAGRQAFLASAAAAWLGASLGLLFWRRPAFPSR